MDFCPTLQPPMIIPSVVTVWNKPSVYNPRFACALRPVCTLCLKKKLQRVKRWKTFWDTVYITSWVSVTRWRWSWRLSAFNPRVNGRHDIRYIWARFTTPYTTTSVIVQRRVAWHQICDSDARQLASLRRCEW